MRIVKTTIGVLIGVLWTWPFQVSAVAMETRLILGPSLEVTQGSGLPSGWQPLQFHDIAAQTVYTVGMDENQYAVKAVSEDSASGLYTEVDLQPELFQSISWEWKVENLIQKGDPTKQSGDDFSARVIVAFHYQSDEEPFFKRVKYELIRLLYGGYPPGSALVYVWDRQYPVGTMFDNAYTDWAKVVVVESGPLKVGQWVVERRNVMEDYHAAFGHDPPQVKFIGILTDTDDTGERAVAYYRQISVDSRSDKVRSIQRADK